MKIDRSNYFIFPIEYIKEFQYKNKKEEDETEENKKRKQKIKNEFEKYLKEELAKYK